MPCALAFAATAAPGLAADRGDDQHLHAAGDHAVGQRGELLLVALGVLDVGVEALGLHRRGEQRLVEALPPGRALGLGEDHADLDAAGRRAQRSRAAAAARRRGVLAAGGEHHRQAQSGGPVPPSAWGPSSSCASVVLSHIVGARGAGMLWAATYAAAGRGANHTESFKPPRLHHDWVSRAASLLCSALSRGLRRRRRRRPIRVRPSGDFAHRPHARSSDGASPDRDNPGRVGPTGRGERTSPAWRVRREAVRVTRWAYVRYGASPRRLLLYVVGVRPSDGGSPSRDRSATAPTTAAMPTASARPGTWASAPARRPSRWRAAGRAAPRTGPARRGAARPGRARRAPRWRAPRPRGRAPGPPGRRSAPGPPGLPSSSTGESSTAAAAKPTARSSRPLPDGRDPRAEQDVGGPHRRGRERPQRAPRGR